MINIAEAALSHNCLRYTTDINTFEKIITNKTFRCTCLASGRLNDAKEKTRNGISHYSNQKFAICFSYEEHESVPFWLNYGNDRVEKVQLVFDNFLKDISANINISVAKTNNGSIYIGNENYNRNICSDGATITKDGFVSDSFIGKIEAFDVEYLPCNSEVFSKSYLETMNFPNIKCNGVEVAFPDCLGKQKTNPWEYEKETRILCTTDLFSDHYYWDWIDLNLVDTVFKNMIVILSPWDNGTQRRRISKAVALSNLSDDIKQSIVIQESELQGTLNF